MFVEKNLNLNNKYFVWDKKCPKCEKILIKETDFCDCGFNFKIFDEYFSLFKIFIYLFIIIFFVSIILFNINNLNNFKVKENFIEVKNISPINIQIMNSLNKKKFTDNIQNFYLKENEKNKLIVVIKPQQWFLLDKNKKDYIYNQVKREWDFVYKKNYPESMSKTFVYIANPE